QTKLLETELRVNRALMNPHFIFNSLNSIRNLILNNQNDEANAYLLKFSKLMRKILEGNISESITLTDEVDILTRYLELEQLRFQTNFSYTITAEDPTTNTQIRLPIMMIQPFVENAIWHGLMNKKGERLLNISFTIQDEKYLFCVVDDNGLGRIQKENVFKNRKSMAIIFVRSRLELINKIHNLDCKLEIIDKQNASGTRVEITLPILT
ncbi:MAG: histidine kinase, partial [Bacteroidia bacterium]|nr:histidine kinase [Bacteroidia bacterium]